MQRILLSQAAPGMIIAKAVVTDSGVTLIGAGKELTGELIAALEQKGIVKVVVEGRPVANGSLPRPPAELERELIARFANVTGDPVMMKIRDLFIARVHANAANQDGG